MGETSEETKMTVRELIEKLQEIEQDRIVYTEFQYWNYPVTDIRFLEGSNGRGQILLPGIILTRE
jgi:hypothetical protein